MSLTFDIDIYGTFIKKYIGEGELVREDNKSYPCQFMWGQTNEGKIICQCLVKNYQEFGFEPHIEKREPILISGPSSDGLQMELYNCKTFNGNINIDALITLVAEYAKINNTSNAEPIELKFYLTNFDYIYLPELEIDGYNIQIICTPKIVNAIRYLKLTNGSMITAILTVKLSNISIESNIDVSRAKEIVSNICQLLSLTQGGRIGWLYMEAYSDNGLIIGSYSNQAYKISKYGSKKIIEFEKGDIIRSFIEQSFSNYIEIKNKYHFDQSIEFYLNALLENNSLELSALMLVVLLDFTTSKLYPDTEGLKNKIDRLKKEYKLNITQDDIYYFNILRNKLAHGAQFYKLNDRIERQEYDSKKWKFIKYNNWSDTRQYNFILSFVNKIMLALVGYKSD